MYQPGFAVYITLGVTHNHYYSMASDNEEAFLGLLMIAAVGAAAIAIGYVLFGILIAVGALLGLAIAIVGFSPLISSLLVWWAAGAPKLFGHELGAPVVALALALIQVVILGGGVGIFHDKDLTPNEVKDHLAKWMTFGVFFGAISMVLFVLTSADNMDITKLQVALYSVFAFLFCFAFTSYFLIDVLPWRDTHPRFNAVLAFSCAIFLSLCAAVTLYAFPGTKDAAQSVAARLFEVLAIAMNLLFAAMGIWLFKKRREVLLKISTAPERGKAPQPPAP
jgi:hypothetical protein